MEVQQEDKKQFNVGDKVLIKGTTQTSVVSEVVNNNEIYFKLSRHKGLFTADMLSIPTNSDMANELKRVVEKWVDSNFNCVYLSVYETIFNSDSCEGVGEYIEPISTDAERDEIDYLEDRKIDLDYRVIKLENWRDDVDSNPMLYDRIDSFVDTINRDIDSIEERIEELENFIETCNDDNYPMFTTIFELKSNWSTLTSKAPEAGFGIINSNDYFNDALFVSGCGYSFVASHWIPLYLSLFEYEAEYYKGVDYSGM